MRPMGAAALALACVAGDAGAQDLPAACRRSQAATLVSAELVEKAAENQYAQLLEVTRSRNALAPQAHPQMVRLRYIVDRIVPFTEGCNDRAPGVTPVYQKAARPDRRFAPPAPSPMPSAASVPASSATR